MKRMTLFRWWRRTQVDIQVRGGFLSLGLDRRAPAYAGMIKWRPIAYYSPDATPMHADARGVNGWGS